MRSKTLIVTMSWLYGFFNFPSVSDMVNNYCRRTDKGHYGRHSWNSNEGLPFRVATSAGIAWPLAITDVIEAKRELAIGVVLRNVVIEKELTHFETRGGVAKEWNHSIVV